MENLRSETAYQEIQKSSPEKAESDIELREEMTPKKFLDRLSSILTSVDTAPETDKQIEKKAKTAKDKFFKRIRPYLFTIMMAFAYSPHLDNPAYEDIESAKIQMDKNGITYKQREAYIPGVSELLQRGIEPYAYSQKEKLKTFVPNIIFGRDKKSQLDNRHGREDAWRLYLGLPQKHDTFEISEYQPSVSIEDKYYYKIKKFLENYLKYYTIRDLIEIISSTDNRNKAILNGGGIMATFTLSKGQDENGSYISYYDLWDLNTIGGNFAGKPFEIYDRIYYNPETFEIIEPRSEHEETKQGR